LECLLHIPKIDLGPMWVGPRVPDGRLKGVWHGGDSMLCI